MKFSTLTILFIVTASLIVSGCGDSRETSTRESKASDSSTLGVIKSLAEADVPESEIALDQEFFEKPEEFALGGLGMAPERGLSITVDGAPVMLSEESEEALPQRESFNTESYDHVTDNSFLSVIQNPLSTFSIDVDTASYSNVRRFLNEGQLPPKGAVRIEELINYFSYDYAPPTNGKPFATYVEIAACPWAETHQLAKVAIKGKVFEEQERPPVNLVFLLDVSGSMNSPNKLPLLKTAMSMLVKELSEVDYVGICVYAGRAGVVLPPTSCEQKSDILAALDKLEAGGSTAGGEGIKLAYSLAEKHFVKGHINRVILCTDGDFNVGVTSQSELVDLIEAKAKGGIFLTVLGFGMGNYKDSMLEKLADKGNGNYGYIDTIREAQKILVEQMSGTLITIAKDVKIQVEFNPAKVGAYRLLGYENRLLRAEDFNDDKKDAGEIGAGHTVTALYELVPPGEEIENLPKVDPLKYQKTQEATDAELTETTHADEWLTLKLRYKQPDGDTSDLIEIAVKADTITPFEQSSADFQFTASVAGFGMLLRDSQYKGTTHYDAIKEWGIRSKGEDRNGYRAEYLQLVDVAKSLAK